MIAENIIKELTQKAGITINGKDSWDIVVHNPKFYSRVLRDGSVGLGEAYMDGWWDAEDIEELFYKIIRAGLEDELKKRPLFLIKITLYKLIGIIFNRSSKKRAFEIGERHYDIGNDLYEKMLDRRMNYSCGYWGGNLPARGLDEAQEHKLDLICKKLYLKKGETILDIGCGWGGFLQFAAERYGTKGVGVSVSKEQVALAKERAKNLPIKFLFDDYRNLSGTFPKIASIGMFEHVGHKNYGVFMKKATNLLTEDGIFLLHTIGFGKPDVRTDPWIEKYIFPNSLLPSISQIEKAMRPYFVMEDWHNFGPDYTLTLREWFKNFDAAWPELKEKYDERFYRMWKYYLLSCAGSFRARELHLWQIVLRKKKTKERYVSVR